MSNFKFQISNFKFLGIGYLSLVIGLFLYSYTQVDLNLTLSQWSVWQVIQKSFQYIGWFERPLSTALYLTIIFLLFTFYLLFLWLIKKNLVTLKEFWVLVLITSGILLFSYNAFSYDLFNYMFYGKIITYYHADPYAYRALDFPQDPWTNFMRWTHNTYPYGPFWLVITVPLSLLGFQFFLPTLFLYKALMAGGYLLSVYFIGKIIEKINPDDKRLGMAFFALNPLVLIESLVSAHNDIVMICLSIISIYFILNSKYIRAIILLFLSIGIKFSTAFLVPIFVFIWIFLFRNKKINWEWLLTFGGLLMTLAITLASFRTELQPWYLLWVLPFISLLVNKKWLIIPSITFSLVSLLHYVPFIYTGNWDPPIPTIKFWLTVFSILLGLVLGVLFRKRIAMMV